MKNSKVIAMWSGPRNISTAMMRSFGNRNDTAVSDEPLYANFLVRTGINHPMRDEVIESMDSDWSSLIDFLSGTIPGEKEIWYQKHMTHHYPDGSSMDWIDTFNNCFLIRNPARVINSYLKIYDIEHSDILGFRQQKEIFDYISFKSNSTPLVIDSDDIVSDPQKFLSLICKYLDIPFSSKMLSWPLGPREYDGVWTKHWYKNVNKSDSFISNINPMPLISKKYLNIYQECLEYYNYLYEYRVQ